jgi:hypothetical protein
MSFLLYFAVLIAALVSVVMGLEVVTQPQPTKPAIQSTGVEPIRHAPAVPVVQEPAVPTAMPASAPVPQALPPRQTVSQSSEEPAEPPCNVQLCSAAYQSFRAADCTYQPLSGPRRMCTK